MLLLFEITSPITWWHRTSNKCVQMHVEKVLPTTHFQLVLFLESDTFVHRFPMSKLGMRFCRLKLPDPSNISHVSQKQCWYGMLNNLAFLILWYFRKFHGSITIKSLIGYWKKWPLTYEFGFFHMFQTFSKCADNDWVIFCIYTFTFPSLPCWTDWRSITIYLYLFIL